MKESDEKHGMCFRCWIGADQGGMVFTFNGGGQLGSRDAFHNRTNREVEAEIHREAKKTGTTIQPKTRWV